MPVGVYEVYIISETQNSKGGKIKNLLSLIF